MCKDCNGKRWVPLHNHSEFSILDGYARVKDYVELAKERDIPGFGLTDHGTCSGLYDLIRECNAAGIQPVPGFEAYVAPENPDGAFHKGPIFYGPNGSKAPKYDVGGNGAHLHITLFAYNAEGLNNLFKLTSLAWEQERFYSKPRIDTDLLFKHSEGLIVTTGCPSSEVSTRFLLGQDEKAYEYASRLKSVFGENMYVEVMDHNMEDDDLERILLPKLVKLAKDLDIPLIATNDSHYVTKEDADGHERMLAMQTGMTMEEPPFSKGGRRFAFSGPEYYMKTHEEMAELFPEDKYPGAICNTNLIVEKCEAFNLDYDPHLRPVIDIPEGETPASYFKQIIQDGFWKKRGHESKEVQEESIKRINHEFEVIHSNDFISYFLVVHDYINYAHKNNIPVGTGRGCFTPKSKVMLADGVEKDIIDVEIGDTAVVYEGIESPVTNKFIYDVKDESMTSILLETNKEIESTSDHMVLTVENGYIRADEVEVGMHLIGLDDGTYNWSDYTGASSSIEYPYTAMFHPDNDKEKVTFRTEGIHRVTSLMEATNIPYLMAELSIEIDGVNLDLEGVTIIGPEGQHMITIAPDEAMGAAPVRQFTHGEIIVVLMSESASKEILISQESESRPIRVVNVSSWEYTGEVVDLEVGGYHNYMVQGAIVHNSVGGSEIAYVTDISDTDPIRFDLLFERFLSPGRGSVYTIEYEDGSTAQVQVSDKMKVVESDGSVTEKYVHELEDGDTIIEE